MRSTLKSAQIRSPSPPGHRLPGTSQRSYFVRWIRSRFRIFSTLNWFPTLLLVVAPFILLSPVLFGGRALFWGAPALQFHPWRVFAWESLQSGHLPLWNPLVGMGAPLIANYQSAFFYPPNWLFFGSAALAGQAGLAWTQAFVVALHLVWAGLGVALLARSIGLGQTSQAVSGLAYGLSGYLVARSGFLSINATAAWLPWIFLAGRAVGLEPDRFSRLRNLALVMGMQLLAGHAQTSWYTIMLAIPWIGFWAWTSSWQSERRSVRGAGFRLGRAALSLVIALVLAAALAGVQLLPTAEYLAQSQRAASIDYDFAVTYSYWPWRFFTLLAPDLYGNPAQGDYWGYANYWEDAVYVGLLPLLMAFRAVFGRRAAAIKIVNGQLAAGRANVMKALVWFLVAILIVSFFLALGSNTPVFPWLYRHVPTFNMFQAPTRFTLWAVFAFALLAGIGVHRIQRPEGRSLYWARLATAGAVAVTMGAGLTWYFLGDIRPTFIRATALAGFVGVAVGALFLVAPQTQAPQARRPWRWAVGVLLTLDLLIAGWGLNPGVALAFYTQPASPVAESKGHPDGHRVYLSADDEYHLKFIRFFRFDSFQAEDDWRNLRAALLPNLNILDRVPHTSNFEPLLPGRYVTWMEALDRSDPVERDRLLNLMGVGWVQSLDPARPSGVRFVQVQGSTRVRWLPCATSAASAADAWDQVVNDRIRLDQEVVVEGAGNQGIPDCDPRSTADLDVHQEGPNQLTIDVDATHAGWLFVADVWYPGWQARVDGQAQPLLRADYLFQAVHVPAGRHMVALVYRPLSFYLGALISAVAAAGLGLRVIRGMRSDEQL